MEKTREKAPITGFLSAVAIAAILYFVLKAVPTLNINLFSYSDIAENVLKSLEARTLWFIQDFTNAQFYASVLGGMGLMLGALIGYSLNQKKKAIGGFTIAYYPRIFPVILVAQLLGLFVSVYMPGFVHLMEAMDMGWVPTFIPFVSVPVIVVFVYGPNIKAVLTGGILSGLMAAPFAAFVIKYWLDPFGLPAVIANPLSMAFVGIVVLEICRYAPWIDKPKEDFFTNPGGYDQKYASEPSEPLKYNTSWFLRRVLADFTEAQFYGNEWASGLMLLGVIIHYYLDPSGVYYGNDFVPLLLATTILTSAVGVFLYQKHWKEKGFFPTFAPVVTVVPGIILMVNGDVLLSIVGAVLGGIITPVFADLINRNIPRGWHPMIGNTLSMSISTLLIATVIKGLMLL